MKMTRVAHIPSESRLGQHLSTLHAFVPNL